MGSTYAEQEKMSHREKLETQDHRGTCRMHMSVVSRAIGNLEDMLQKLGIMDTDKRLVPSECPCAAPTR